MPIPGDNEWTPQSRARRLGSSRESRDNSSAQQRRAFFPDEVGESHPCSDPYALAEGRFDPPPLPAEASTQTRLLSEVDWLIAGTRAALGEDADNLGYSVAATPAKFEESSSGFESPSERDDLEGDSVPENDGSQGQYATDHEEDENEALDAVPEPAAALEPEPLGNGGLVITPDKREAPDSQPHDTALALERGDLDGEVLSSRGTEIEYRQEVASTGAPTVSPEGDAVGATKDNDRETQEVVGSTVGTVADAYGGDAVQHRFFAALSSSDEALSKVSLYSPVAEAVIATASETTSAEREVALPERKEEHVEDKAAIGDRPAVEPVTHDAATEQVGDDPVYHEPVTVAEVDSDDAFGNDAAAASDIETTAVIGEMRQAVEEPVLNESMAGIWVDDEVVIDGSAADERHVDESSTNEPLGYESVLVSADGCDDDSGDDAGNTVSVNVRDVLEGKVEKGDGITIARGIADGRTNNVEAVQADAPITPVDGGKPLDDIEQRSAGENERRFGDNITEPSKYLAVARSAAGDASQKDAKCSAAALVEEVLTLVPTPAYIDTDQAPLAASELPANMPSMEDEREENADGKDGGDCGLAVAMGSEQLSLDIPRAEAEQEQGSVGDKVGPSVAVATAEVIVASVEDVTAIKAAGVALEPQAVTDSCDVENPMASRLAEVHAVASRVTQECTPITVSDNEQGGTGGGSETAAVVGRSSLSSAALAETEFDDSETEAEDSDQDDEAVPFVGARKKLVGTSAGVEEHVFSVIKRPGVESEDLSSLLPESDGRTEEVTENRVESDSTIQQETEEEVERRDTSVTTLEDGEGEEENDSPVSALESDSVAITSATVDDDVYTVPLTDDEAGDKNDPTSCASIQQLPFVVGSAEAFGSMTRSVKEVFLGASLMALDDDAASAVASSDGHAENEEEEVNNNDSYSDSDVALEPVPLVAQAEPFSATAVVESGHHGLMSSMAEDDDDAASAVDSTDAHRDEENRDDVVGCTAPAEKSGEEMNIGATEEGISASEIAVASLVNDAAHQAWPTGHLDDDAESAVGSVEGNSDIEVHHFRTKASGGAPSVGPGEEAGQAVDERYVGTKHDEVGTTEHPTAAVVVSQEREGEIFAAIAQQLTPVPPVSVGKDGLNQASMRPSQLPVDAEPLAEPEHQEQDNGHHDDHEVGDSPVLTAADALSTDEEVVAVVKDKERNDGTLVAKTAEGDWDNIVDSPVAERLLRSDAVSVRAAASASVAPSIATNEQHEQQSGSSRSGYSAGLRTSSSSDMTELKSTGFKSVTLARGASVKTHPRQPGSRALSSTTGSYFSQGASSSRTLKTSDSLKARSFKSIDVVGEGSTKDQQSRSEKSPSRLTSNTSGARAGYSLSTSRSSALGSSSVRPEQKTVKLKATGFKSVSLAPSLISSQQRAGSSSYSIERSMDAGRVRSQGSLGELPDSVLRREERGWSTSNGAREMEGSAFTCGIDGTASSSTRATPPGADRVSLSGVLDVVVTNGEYLNGVNVPRRDVALTDVSLDDKE